MRRIAPVALALLVAALPLSAQFEGTLAVKMHNGDKSDSLQAMTWYLKSGKMAMTMMMPANSGMGSGEIRVIIDPATRTSTMLMPMSPEMASRMGGMGAGAKGMKIVSSMDSTDEAKSDDATVTKLGTSETVAGLRCDDYQIKERDQKPTKACLTTDLGTFVFPAMMGVGRRGSAAPAWTQAFGNKPVFPLKVWDEDGKPQLEVVSVTRGSVPSAVFMVPDGYMDMSSFMGGMGRRGGGH